MKLVEVTRYNFYLKWIITLNLCVATTLPAFSQTIVSHNFAPDSDDRGYEYHLLELSLERTKDEYGEYTLVPVSDSMNVARRISSLRTNRYTNFIQSNPYHDNLSETGDLAYAEFPVYLGILGYRTCFTSEENLSELSKVNSRDDLLKFTQGLDKTWIDAKILRANGFSVKGADNYYTLFDMTAANRFHLFCRGANEVHSEFKYNQHIPGLAYERNLALYYPLPHFFYGHISDRELIDRVEMGLLKAYEDGSVRALWDRYFGERVSFVKLEDRSIYSFSNPFIETLSNEYNRYVYRPSKNNEN